jgi:hypothetical protein
MSIHTFSEDKLDLATLLEQAIKEGEARIKRQDGQVFVIRPEPKTDSPLDVPGINLGITTAEIVQFVHESRRTYSADTDIES